MLKNTLAMVVVGSLISSNSFAAPLHIEKLFMKEHVKKSFVVSNNHNLNSPSKFSGTWEGVCSYGDTNQKMKFRIKESDDDLSLIDLLNEGDDVNYHFNIVESENISDSIWYYTSTHRLTRVDEKTLKLESVDVDTPQLPSEHAEKGFTSSVSTVLLTVNNNDLTMNMSGTTFFQNKAGNIDGKCTFKRAE